MLSDWTYPQFLRGTHLITKLYDCSCHRKRSVVLKCPLNMNGQLKSRMCIISLLPNKTWEKISFCWYIVRGYIRKCYQPFSFWEGSRRSRESVKAESSTKPRSEFAFLFSWLFCLGKVIVVPCSDFLICKIEITVTDLLWSDDKSSVGTAIKMAEITPVMAVRQNSSALYQSTVLKNQGLCPLKTFMTI